MKTEESKVLNETTNTVPLKEFENATQKWESVTLDNNGMLDNVILANTFEIPRMDIINLAKEIVALGPDEVSSIRAYIGIEEYSGDPKLSEMKLFFTGVNQANLPILEDPEGHSAIYDFVTPCPPTCQGNGGGSSK
jgi:hypothetical protein